MLFMCTPVLFVCTIYLKTTLDTGLVLATLLASSLFYLLILFHYHAIPVTASVTDILCADCFSFGFYSITTLFQ